MESPCNRVSALSPSLPTPPNIRTHHSAQLTSSRVSTICDRLGAAPANLTVLRWHHPTRELDWWCAVSGLHSDCTELFAV